MKHLTAAQEQTIEDIMRSYRQSDGKVRKQRKKGKQTKAVVLSFNLPGRVIVGTFRHSFIVNDDGSYTKKTTFKGVL